MLLLLAAVVVTQALKCVNVMALLMQQHLRGVVTHALATYAAMWQQFGILQGSRVAYAGGAQLLLHALPPHFGPGCCC